MRLPDFVINALQKRLWMVGARPPDLIVKTNDTPYLYRWYVGWHGPLFNIDLHYIVKSDEARCLHDHPWPNMSIILDGSYVEESPKGVYTTRRKGDIVFRGPWKPHRIILADEKVPTTSLFLTGPRLWKWGFYTREGWKEWLDVVDREDGGNNRNLDTLCE